MDSTFSVNIAKSIIKALKARYRNWFCNDEKIALQSQLYADMMQACIESGVWIAFLTWGVSDSMSWISAKIRNNVYDIPIKDAAPLLFDAAYQPKPAYFSVQKVLLNALNSMEEKK